MVSVGNLYDFPLMHIDVKIKFKFHKKEKKRQQPSEFASI